MDPTELNDRLLYAADDADDDLTALPEDDSDEGRRGPGEGDAMVMAWARAM